jgi:predicted kinase
LAAERACLDAPRQFPSAHSRFLYFRKPGRDPNYLAHDDCRAEVIVLSGLPGAGKDSWIRNYGPAWPVISLDALRERLEWTSTGDQGPIVAAAREEARKHLRAGQSLIWNSTNLSRELRGQVIDLAAAYGARVRIVAVEAAAAKLWERNARRERPVPPAAIDRLLNRWETPDLTEAHQVDFA